METFSVYLEWEMWNKRKFSENFSMKYITPRCWNSFIRKIDKRAFAIRQQLIFFFSLSLSSRKTRPSQSAKFRKQSTNKLIYIIISTFNLLHLRHTPFSPPPPPHSVYVNSSGLVFIALLAHYVMMHEKAATWSETISTFVFVYV